MNDNLILGRRNFLVSAGVGSLAVTLRPPALAAAEKAGEKRREITFVVVTDTHLGYRDKPAATKLWQTETAPEIAKVRADFVLHLGDIVDGGREAEYPNYLAGRKAIAAPVHEIPGNHDPHELFEKYLRKPIESAVEHEWLRVLLVGNAHRDSHEGFLTDEQLEWLAKELAAAAAKGQKVLIAMHVPAHTNKHPDRGWYVKPEHGQTKLYEMLTAHRERVIALLHGHFHNGVRGWDDHAPVQEICFPSALYNQDRNLAEQKAPGYYLNELRPGYTVVTISGEKLKLEYRVTGVSEVEGKEFRI